MGLVCARVLTNSATSYCSENEKDPMNQDMHELHCILTAKKKTIWGGLCPRFLGHAETVEGSLTGDDNILIFNDQDKV